MKIPFELHSGEEVLRKDEGFLLNERRFKGRAGTFYLTNQRVIFVRKYASMFLIILGGILLDTIFKKKRWLNSISLDLSLKKINSVEPFLYKKSLPSFEISYAEGKTRMMLWKNSEEWHKVLLECLQKI